MIQMAPGATTVPIYTMTTLVPLSVAESLRAATRQAPWGPSARASSARSGLLCSLHIRSGAAVAEDAELTEGWVPWPSDTEYRPPPALGVTSSTRLPSGLTSTLVRLAFPCTAGGSLTCAGT